MDYIEAFFEHWEKKIVFLQELYQSGHQDEAATLCYACVDGFGENLCGSNKGSAFGFVRVLCEHGQNPFLPLIHPEGLIRWLKKEKNSFETYKTLAGKLEAQWKNRKSELLEENEFCKLMLPNLTQKEKALFKKHLWRGTLAHSAYIWLRSPSVHSLRWYQEISFGSMTYQDTPIPGIEFKIIDIMRNKLKWVGA